MKPITLLGSTGSIGTQTLDIVSEHPDKFRIVGLAAGRNVELFAAQIRQFRPQIAAISAAEKLPELKEAIKVMHSIHEKGYSVMDILDNYFLLLNVTDSRYSRL